MSAAQMNVVEFHTWNAVKTAIEKPDRLVLDLDPGEGVSWQTVQQAAQLVRVLLQGVGLEGWLKMSGGKRLARGRAIAPAVRVGRRQRLLGGHGASRGTDTTAAIRGQEWPHKPRRQDLRGLPAQRLRGDNRCGLVGPCETWSGRISAPVLERVGNVTSGAQWTISNIHDRLDVANSPWDDYTPQSISKAMAAINYVPTPGKR